MEYFKVNPLILERGLEQEAQQDTIKKFEEYKEENKIFSMKFTKGSRDTGDLVAFLGEGMMVRVIMKDSENYLGSMSKVHISIANRLKQKYNVLVEEIDKEKKIVYVSSKKACAIIRNELIEQMKPLMRVKPRNRKEKIVMKAKVCYVNVEQNVVIIDLNDCGLLGYIRPEDWDGMFHTRMSDVAKSGQIIDVEVLHIVRGLDWIKGKKLYRCSRRNILPNKWIGIENKFVRGDIVEVTVVELTGKVWHGEIEGLPGIQVIGEYKEGNPVKVGDTRDCTVYRVDEKKHLFVVRL